ncbi:MAG: ribose-5-phosphate isomerase RpiA [Phycisphaerales bacterium]
MTYSAGVTTQQRDRLAEMAVEPVRAGMLVGLGTGRAASRAIRALAARVKGESLDVRCVATSVASAELGKSLGLRVLEFEEAERIDYLFDGADEVDGALRMIKGRGGAMTREKIAAQSAEFRVYLVDASKLVTRLGEKHPLPVEALSYGLGATRARLAALGSEGEIRTGEGGNRYVTDAGNPVLDVTVPEGADVERLAREIDAIPGVVGHGLFLHEADEVLVEDASGAVTRRVRR